MPGPANWCAPAVALRARIEIVGQPAGITPGLVDFTLFGVAVPQLLPGEVSAG